MREHGGTGREPGSGLQRAAFVARAWLAEVGVVPVVGGLVIGLVVLVTFQPDQSSGFRVDDFYDLGAAGSIPGLDYLVWSFDPRLQTVEYRPVQHLQWKVEYLLFGGDAAGYHVVQNLVHLLACLLLFAVVWRVTARWLAGFVSALIYSVLSFPSVSVFWPSVTDPAAAFFSLAAIWFWVDYLKRGRRLTYFLALLSFVLALLTKEIVVILPPALLLIDRWLIRRPATWHTWTRRIAPFFFLLGPWLIVEWSILASKAAGEVGRSSVTAIVSNQLFFIGGLVFPWRSEAGFQVAALVVLLALFVYAVVTRRLRALFLAVMAPLSVMPMASSLGYDPRYLYIPLMLSSVGIGTLIDRVFQAAQALAPGRVSRYASLAAVAALVTALTLLGSSGTADAQASFAANASQTRLAFRPIYQRHPAFPPGTFLYFVDPPLTSRVISGMMFLHYGRNVSVGGSDFDAGTDLRKYESAYVVYTDESGEPREQHVDRAATLEIVPALPVQFGPGIVLQGFQVVNTRAAPGDAIILILYFNAAGEIDEDYTVFAHLVDANGAMLAGYDSQPGHGTRPTTSWRPGNTQEDAIAIPVPADAPPGSGYRIEVGLYYLPTMARLPILKGVGEPGGGGVVFGSFSVEP